MLFTEYEVVYVEYTCVWHSAVHCASSAGAAGSVSVLCMQEGYSMSGVCVCVWRGGVMVSVCTGVGS